MNLSQTTGSRRTFTEHSLKSVLDPALSLIQQTFDLDILSLKQLCEIASGDEQLSVLREEERFAPRSSTTTDLRQNSSASEPGLAMTTVT